MLLHSFAVVPANASTTGSRGVCEHVVIRLRACHSLGVAVIRYSPLSHPLPQLRHGALPKKHDLLR